MGRVKIEITHVAPPVEFAQLMAELMKRELIQCIEGIKAEDLVAYDKQTNTVNIRCHLKTNKTIT